MARKPASMYRYIKQQAYTRREYMGGIPHSRITQCVMGNKKGTFPIRIVLCASERCQIRHTALEAARIITNWYLEKKMGISDYKLTLRVYPYHIIRENKQATGAGADRVSQGMRASFGKVVGTAARVEIDQVIMIVKTNEKHIVFTKNALREAAACLPISCRKRVGG